MSNAREFAQASSQQPQPQPQQPQQLPEQSQPPQPTPQPIQVVQSQQLIWKKAILPMVTGGLAGSTVAIGTYPIDVFITRLQAGVNKTAGTPSIMALLYGLIASLKLSLTRNTIVIHKEKVHENVHEAITEKGATPTSSQRFAATTSTGVVIGLCDTTATNYFRNYRTFTSFGVIPTFITWQQKIVFAKIAYGINFSRNTLNAFFLVSANKIFAPFISQFIPAAQYPWTNLIFSNVGAGFVSGALITPLDVIAKRILKGTNVATFKSPTVYQVMKELFHAKGLPPFYKGAMLNIINQIVVFVILSVDFEKYGRLMLYMPLNEERASRRVTPTLFQPAPRAQSRSDLEDDTKVNIKIIKEQPTEQPSPRPKQ